MGFYSQVTGEKIKIFCTECGDYEVFDMDTFQEEKSKICEEDGYDILDDAKTVENIAMGRLMDDHAGDDQEECGEKQAELDAEWYIDNAHKPF
jgi:hypothetical protein